MDSAPTFEAWQAHAAAAHRADRLWSVKAYQLALYALEVGWEDATALDRNQLTGPIAAQLYRALGSIAANIAEGYSRSTGFDRARFFEYALGSTRESDVWCLAGRSALGQAVLEARAEILAEIRKLLLAAITLERTRGRNRIVRRKAGAD